MIYSFVSCFYFCALVLCIWQSTLSSMQCCYRTAMAGGPALLDKIWVWPKNDETAARRTRLSIQRPGDVLHETVASEAYHDWSGEAAGARLRVNSTLKLLLSQNFCNWPLMRFISLLPTLVPRPRYLRDRLGSDAPVRV